MPLNSNSSYLKKNRLSDVLALIQVLSLDKLSKRSETGLLTEFKISPKSGTNWTSIALEHPEFFRVDPDKKQSISLVARHVTELNESGKRELSIDFVKVLLNLAIELHKIEKDAANSWKVWVAIIAVIITGILNILVTILVGKGG